jgi:hypothetical protein
MTPRDFAIEPPHRLLWALPLFIAFAPVVVAVLLLGTGAPAREWLRAAPLALMPIVALVLAQVLFGNRLRLSDAGLRIRTPPWPRTIPVSQMDLARSEIVDLRERRELQPLIKLAGSRMPGFRAGRFRLRDKRWASVILTDPRRVLVLPLVDGRVLLFSVQQPQLLLEALRRLA